MPTKASAASDSKGSDVCYSLDTPRCSRICCTRLSSHLLNVRTKLACGLAAAVEGRGHAGALGGVVAPLGAETVKKTTWPSSATSATRTVSAHDHRQ
jgi:hypothetical protein